MSTPQQPATQFQSASLYVGEIHPEITESNLFELFSRVGPVASIRVCRDSVTRRSLGYAYVNFHSAEDAERALDTMNFQEIKGKACRIMWSQRDPSLRRSGVGNVFLRNLPPSVDQKGLYDIFSVFGNILSCKVSTDDQGNSKGYGYVHFETAQAAQDAIQKFTGTLIDDQEVTVGLFVRRQDRAGQADWTNLYVKQFPTSWDEKRLRDLFATYGTIANVAILKDQEGRSKGFGFVNFAEHEAAKKALEELHNKSVEDGDATVELYVNRAQKKGERQREIKNRVDVMNQERVSKYQGMNLYVKNIHESVTDEAFREAFAQFGTITSARIMYESTEPKTSKGFGFVCYSSSEEAARALAEMNNKLLGGKPLVVTLHQRKEYRKAQLAATYGAQNMRFPQSMSPGVPMPYMGMYMPQGQQGFPVQPALRQGAAGFPFPYAPNQMNARNPAAAGMGARNGPYAPRPPYFPAGGVQQGGFLPGPPQQGQPQGPQGPQGQQPGAFANRGGRFPGPNPAQPYPMQGGMPNMQAPMGGPGRGRGPPMPVQGPPMGMGQRPQPYGAVQGRPQGYPMSMQQQMQQQQQQGLRNGVKFSNQARNQNGQMMQGVPMQQQQMAMQQQASAPSKMDFSDSALASADPVTQKNMIGERLYPLIHHHQPEQAGKITGMLLEMDNGELLNLIESPDALQAKIEEALVVLRNHKPSDE